MQKNRIKSALFDFRNALGINNFSKDLSETEFRLISLVSEAQDSDYNIKLTEISEKLNVTRSAITQVTNKLVEKEYIEKYTLPTNKKEVYLRIGKKAIEQYDKVVAKITFFFEKLFEEIGQEGVDNIERYIDIAKKIGMQMKMESEKDA